MGRSILRVPGSHAIYRAGLYYSADTVLSPIVRSRVLGHPAKWIAKRHLRSQVPDECLLEALTPSYRIGSKRILFDRHFYPALNKQNVHLITDPIERISPTSIETKSGETKPVDIIICATGFKASEFLVPSPSATAPAAISMETGKRAQKHSWASRYTVTLMPS